MAALRGAHRGRIVALVLCSCQRERELSRLFALHIQRQRCLWESLGHTRFCPPFVDFASMSVVAWTRTFYGVAHVQVGKCGKGVRNRPNAGVAQHLLQTLSLRDALAQWQQRGLTDSTLADGVPAFLH